jgi:translocator protein
MSAMSGNHWLMLLFFLLACYSAALLAASWTSSYIDRYADLTKPSFNPPTWIFAPVWSVFYFMMALSAWLVWRRADRHSARLAFTLFFTQLGLNIVWTWLFFGLRRPGAALVEIVFLLAFIGARALAFLPVSSLAALFMAPYALWVAFATLLNFKIWQLNPGAA